MFYSTEILGDKKYALSTVWRAGNTALGARTTGLRRKAILDVNLERACGTIMDPPGAPIALRLQGTLLYGTARIFQEKCRFILTDGERIQRAMLKLCSSLMDDKLDHNAGKAKTAQIALPNDPGFDLEFLQLPPFDIEAEGGEVLSQTRQNSWTTMSLQSQRSSAKSNNTLLPQLVLDGDSSGHQSYAGGFRYSASGASNMQDSPTPFGRPFGFQEDELMADIGLTIDENGNIIEDEPQLPEFPESVMHDRTAKSSKQHGVPASGDGTADERGKENQLQKQQQQPALMLMDDEEMILPPVPPTDSSAKETVTTASSKHGRQRLQHKANFVDPITQIPLSEYFSHVTNYAADMQHAADRRDRSRNTRRANNTVSRKQEAYEMTFGRGLFAVANQLGKRHADHPLAELFAGELLEEAMYGASLSRAKRARLDAEAATAVPSTPMARGANRLDGQDDIEVARQPGSALSDNPSLPWNRNSSHIPGSSVHGSVQRSAGAHPVDIGMPGSTGRHSSPNFIERYSDEGMGMGMGMNLLPSQSLGPSLPAVGSSPPPPGLAPDHGSEHEQGGGEESLRDSETLYALVLQQAAEYGMRRPGPKGYRWVSFADVVSPMRKNKNGAKSRVAVVSAFMSLLTLATSRQVRVQQEETVDLVLDREIFVGIKKTTGQTSSVSVLGDGLKSREDLMSGHVFPGPEMDEADYSNGEEPMMTAA